MTEGLTWYEDSLSPVLARLCRQSHRRGTSALTPKSDIQLPMSVIVLIPSALPRKADGPAVRPESP